MSGDAGLFLGIDALLADPGAWLGARPGGATRARPRVGLVANQASLTSTGTPTLEALRACEAVDLVCLLTPEHGFSGFEDDATPIPDRRDARTGLAVHSLYGPRRRPGPTVLADLDVVVFDVQEVGVRCYTYATTMALLIEALAEHGGSCRLVVCDRPSLLGPRVAGSPLDPTLRSFIGYLPVPFQHGRTIGELAAWWAEVVGVEDRVVVVPVGGRAGALTGTLPFIPPSPGLPTREAVALYPGLVLLEGVNLSEGRGTPLPFQLLGAPWLESYALAAELNALGLDGLLFRPLSFRPESGTCAHETCHGVQLHVTDAGTLRALEAVLAVLRVVRSAHPDRFAWVENATLPWSREPGAGELYHEPVTGLLIDSLLGSRDGRRVIEGELDLAAAVATWVSRNGSAALTVDDGGVEDEDGAAAATARRR